MDKLYLIKYGEVDESGNVYRKGCFAKSKLTNIPVFVDTRDNIPVSFAKLHCDEIGLYMVPSIGYHVETCDFEDTESNLRIIKKARIMEIAYG
jgi:hypothetical protein